MRDITWCVPMCKILISHSQLREEQGIFCVGTFNVKGKIECKFFNSKNFQNYHLLGGLEIMGMKSSNFYCKRHVLAWIHVTTYIWAILCEDWLRGLTSRVGGKSQKVTRGSHSNNVSPITQGYRAACDGLNFNRWLKYRWAGVVWRIQYTPWKWYKQCCSYYRMLTGHHTCSIKLSFQMTLLHLYRSWWSTFRN